MRALGRLTLGGVAIPRRLGGRGRLETGGEPALLRTPHFLLRNLTPGGKSQPLKQQQDKRIHTLPRVPRTYVPQPAVWTA